MGGADGSERLVVGWRGRLLCAGVAESAVAAHSFVDAFHFFPTHFLIAGYNHLTHPFAIVDGEGFVGEVEQYHLHFASEVGINCAGSVGNGYAVAQGEAAAGSYLTFKPLRQLHIEACGDEGALQGLEHDRLGEECPHVHAGSTGSFVGWQGMVGAVDYFYFGEHDSI